MFMIYKQVEKEVVVIVRHLQEHLLGWIIKI